LLLPPNFGLPDKLRVALASARAKAGKEDGRNGIAVWGSETPVADTGNGTIEVFDAADTGNGRARRPATATAAPSPVRRPPASGSRSRRS